jgi:hypothetical protein
VPTPIPPRRSGEENAGRCHRDRGQRNRGTTTSAVQPIIIVAGADHARQTTEAVLADDPLEPSDLRGLVPLSRIDTTVDAKPGT